jgi:hypothetical protein
MKRSKISGLPPHIAGGHGDMRRDEDRAAEPRKATLVPLDPTNWRAFKILCQVRGVRASDLLNQLIAEHLEASRNELPPNII